MQKNIFHLKVIEWPASSFIILRRPPLGEAGSIVTSSSVRPSVCVYVTLCGGRSVLFDHSCVTLCRAGCVHVEGCSAAKTKTGKKLQPRNAAVPMSSFAGCVTTAGV